MSRGSKMHSYSVAAGTRAQSPLTPSLSVQRALKSVLQIMCMLSQAYRVHVFLTSNENVSRALVCHKTQMCNSTQTDEQCMQAVAAAVPSLPFLAAFNTIILSNATACVQFLHSN